MSSKPVGELKKLVSLVDRSGFDEFVYPTTTTSTKFQPDYKPYHNFTQETVVLPFSGSPAWGQRITFDMPWPWQGDFLNWITLRMKPLSWYTGEQLRRFGNEIADWVPLDSQSFWIWAKNLGSIMIAKAEMEVDGVIIEQFSGDWLHVWNKTMHTSSQGAAYDQSYGSYTNPTLMNMHAAEDGYVYATLPFCFSKHVNTAFPMLSCKGPHSIRFHITLRPFSQVVRKIGTPIRCGETPQGYVVDYRDYSFPFRKISKAVIPYNVPTFESADIVCGFSHIDGPLRKAYIESSHELLLEPVVETTFSEPLKYAVNTSESDTIKIGLPLTMANGPIKQLLFFLRRTAVSQHNDWTNYSAMLTHEQDSVWNPERPLLKRAQLMVGTAVWVDEDERWWRATHMALPGGIRGYGNYIYGYNFATNPAGFDPSGSLNASRADMRLNLTVSPPGGSSDAEWSVSVFLVGTNWIRFQNGLANLLFMD